MLRGMREASNNWIGKTVMATVMGVLIISFAIWGIADIFRGFGRSTLAKVGGTEIGIEQFRQVYTERLQQYGRQFGRPLTSEQARMLGVDRQILQQVVAEAALDENARRQGLGISDAAVAEAIRQDPNFRGLSGQFDPNRFAQIIRQSGYSEARYVSEQRKLLLRRQVAATLGAGLEAPAMMLDAYHRFENETRKIEYIYLTPAQAGDIPAPAPEALTKYFEDHKAQFRAPETRKVALLLVTPEAIGQSITVSDDDAKKAYGERIGRYTVPEKREVQQMVFPDEAAAKAAADKIAAGEDFVAVATARGLKASDIELGNVAKASIADSAVADAAFALDSGKVSAPVKGRFGYVLVKVTAITPGKTPSYDDLAVTLKKDLAAEQARKKIQDLHNQIEDDRAGGANSLDIGKKRNLPTISIDAIDRAGNGADGKPVTALPKGLNIVTQVFASDVGVENEALQLDGGYVWYDVMGVTPSRERTLDEVKAQVEARWRDEQIGIKLREKADALAKEAQGKPLAGIAAAQSLKVETRDGIKRRADKDSLPRTVVDETFRLSKDGVGAVPGKSSSEYYVIRMVESTVPAFDANAADAKSLATSLRSALADDLVGQYIGYVQNRIGTQINNDALAQVTGASGNSSN